ncbi:MAG: hypothetical protein JNL50_07945, partial [Phycisphaerae bacterium]|nr:hypothetical protein [Phycisphaerae bacterium]
MNRTREDRAPSAPSAAMGSDFEDAAGAAALDDTSARPTLDTGTFAEDAVLSGAAWDAEPGEVVAPWPPGCWCDAPEPAGGVAR